MSGSRRGRRVLQTDATSLLPLDDSTQPTVPITAAWSSPFTTVENVTETNEPPLKRFKLPDEVLRRLGQGASADTSAPTDTKLTKDYNAANDGDGPHHYDHTKRVEDPQMGDVDALTEAVRARRAQTTLSSKPVISVRRTPRYPKNASHLEQTPSTLPFNHFQADMIRFDSAPHTRAEDSSSSSSDAEDVLSDSDEGRNGMAATRAARRRRQEREEIDRHFTGYGSEELDEALGSALESDSSSHSHGFSGEEAEEEQEEEEEEEREEEREVRDNGSGGEVGESRGGFGLLERRQQQQRTTREKPSSMQDCQNHSHMTTQPPDIPSNTNAAARHRYGMMTFEMHIGQTGTVPCHHTLLCLKGPITIQGPCGVIGFGMGETAVGGFLLGRKHITLLSATQRVAMTPIRRLKTKAADLEALPRLGPLLHKKFQQESAIIPTAARTNTEVVKTQIYEEHKEDEENVNEGRARNGNANDNQLHHPHNHDDEENDEDDDDLEALFGDIDWDWVEATVARWRGRFLGKIPSVVLVVQPYDPYGPPPTRRHYFKQKKNHKSPQTEVAESLAEDAYMDLPRFIARRHETSIDAVLLPDVIPTVLRQPTGSVVVVGSQGIGKSTLARFLANGLLSQHGLCYWLDLDIGQPEFSPPGVLSLYCVRRPLLRPRDVHSVELVRSYYLGGSRLRCPLSTAIAIAELCAIVSCLQRRHPVVVNTHGWVLSTGRRMAVEAIRRLQPRHIIHLVLEHEPRWARDTTALMDPMNGLNSEALHKRFIVQHPLGSVQGDAVNRLPHPQNASIANTSAHVKQSNDISSWNGYVHTVQVEREDTAPRGVLRPKASVLRQEMWQQHLAPLLRHYANRGRCEAPELTHTSGGQDERVNKRRQIVKQTTEIEECKTGSVYTSDSTTLFVGSLDQFKMIVITDAATSMDLSHDVVCAALERSVVALSFSRGTPTGEAGGRCRCLVDLPSGFPISCFGFVESTEAEMRRTRNIRIRLPLPRNVLGAMLTSAPTERVDVSMACSMADRMDTVALEVSF